MVRQRRGENSILWDDSINKPLNGQVSSFINSLFLREVAKDSLLDNIMKVDERRYRAVNQFVLVYLHTRMCRWVYVALWCKTLYYIKLPIRGGVFN